MSVDDRRILLVEDDANHRASLADILTEHGYTVVQVGSAEEALDQLHVAPFDLLITDYRLGGATGTWLARISTRFGLSRPRVLLVSAYRHLSDADGLEVLRKPFERHELLAKVEAVLSGPTVDEPVGPEPSQRIALTLYVSDSMLSLRATKNLKAVLAGYREDQISLTVVNLSQQRDHQAEQDRIVVTPTLLKTFPAPRVWLTGNLERRDLVDRLLSQAGVDRLAAVGA